MPCQNGTSVRSFEAHATVLRSAVISCRPPRGGMASQSSSPPCATWAGATFPRPLSYRSEAGLSGKNDAPSCVQTSHASACLPTGLSLAAGAAPPPIRARVPQLGGPGKQHGSTGTVPTDGGCLDSRGGTGGAYRQSHSQAASHPLRIVELRATDSSSQQRCALQEPRGGRHFEPMIYFLLPSRRNRTALGKLDKETGRGRCEESRHAERSGFSRLPGMPKMRYRHGDHRLCSEVWQAAGALVLGVPDLPSGNRDLGGS